MNHPFMHLLWKSYRSQREIWLTMLGGMLLVQLLALTNSGSAENPFTIAMFITVLCAPAFLCFSTLLIFVMEEEQETALWLRLLPIKWWHQLAAGLLCSVGLTAVIAVLGMMIAFAACLLFQTEIPTQSIMHATGINVLFVLPIWIVGLTASVLVRRVIIILPIIAVFGIVNAVLTFDLRVSWPPIVASIVAVCILPFAVRRWQLGRPWNWRPVVSLSAKTDVAISGSDIEESSLRTRLLRRAAMADGLQHRTTLVLYWQELVCAVPFAIVGLAFGIASVISCRVASYPPPLEHFWLVFFTMECGLRTFRHDQQKQHGLFWAHRGVSPIKVWLIKNSVWLPILIFSALAMTFLDGFHQVESPDKTLYGLHSSMIYLADPLATTHQFLEPWLINGSRTSPTHMLIAIVTTGYFVAQLCSVWLRPPFVAGFIALIAFIAIPQWVVRCQSSDIPLTFSTWPIAAFCCVATVWTSRRWMDRYQDGWIWTRRIIALCLLPLGLWLGHTYYRRAQIPNGVAAFDLSRKVIYGQAEEDLLIGSKDTRTENSVTDGLWRDLMLHGDDPVKPELFDELGNFPARSRQIIQDIMATEGWYNSLLPIELRTSWQASIAPVVGRQVISEANRLVRTGKAGEAFDLLCKGVQLTEYLAGQTTDWAEIQYCMDVLRGLHQHIHWCVSSDQVTAQELRLAAKQFEVQEDYSYTLAYMLRNRENAFFELSVPNGKLAQEFTRHKLVSFAGSQAWHREYQKLSMTDRIRHMHLLRVSTIAAAIQLRNGQRRITEDLLQWNGQLQRWAKTTSEFGFESDPVLDPWLSNRKMGPLASIDAAVNCRNATWWILQMQLYRREVGRLPIEAQLRDWLAGQGLNSPMRTLGDHTTNQPYELRLQGSGVETLTFFRDIGVLLDANQPVMGDSGNMSLPSDIKNTVKDPVILPLNKDRVVFVEQANNSPAVPPVSGELAELIRNKK